MHFFALGYAFFVLLYIIIEFQSPFLPYPQEDDDITEYTAKSTFPMLLGVGESPFETKDLIICVEGSELVNVSSCTAESVLSCLYAIYYIFSIEYPKDHRDFFFFVDCVLVGLQSTTCQNRISVQTLVKELENFSSQSAFQNLI